MPRAHVRANLYFDKESSYEAETNTVSTKTTVVVGTCTMWPLSLLCVKICSNKSF